MSVKVVPRFYYKVKVNRDEHMGIREGIVAAPDPHEACEIIADLAISCWNRPLAKIELFTIDSDGEMIPVDGCISDRINAVLRTHKEHPDGSRIGKHAEYRKVKPSEEKKPPAKKKPVQYNTDWPRQVGTIFTRETFGTLKL